MPVIEIAILRFPSPDQPSDSLRQHLNEAKNAMASYSGHQFFFYRCLEDPTTMYIFGAWPSVEFHMSQWIPSAENQHLLMLLDGQLTVETMFHVDVGQSTTALPVNCKVMAIERYCMKPEERGDFEEVFGSRKKDLQEFAGEGNVIGGWRVDRDGEKEEFVLFSGWESQERHLEFANTKGFAEYSKLQDITDVVDVKHAKRMD